MNTLRKFECFTSGLAIFAMFFGAGNIIFPLALGQFAMDKISWALAGLLLTAVAMPFIGLLAMFRYEGQVVPFFGRLGKIPGFALACAVIALLGPFGGAPRCIALAYSTLSTTVPGISLVLFSLVSCSIIFFFAYRENRILKLIGYVLSPFKIALLVWIIIKGCMETKGIAAASVDASEISLFLHGLKEGYNTMDLLAALFFAPIILRSIGTVKQDSQSARFLIKASAIGALLLALVYIGFGFLSYLYSSQLEGFSSDRLLAAIAMKVLGPYAGLIVSLTVAIACLTTAIALIAAFVGFVHKEVFGKKIGYMPILLASTLLTFAVATLEFRGIANLLGPVLEISYPGLILLTFYNLFFPKRSIADVKN